MVNLFQEMSDRLAMQEIKLAQQAAIISRLERAVMSNDRKWKPEVLETGKNKLLPYSQIR